MRGEFYYAPEKCRLQTIGEIDWSSGSYEFDLTVVWRREDGFFVYGEDSGCSCPSPFENQDVDDLTVLPSVGGLEQFKAHLEKRNAEAYYNGTRDPEIAGLLERMHAAGAR